MSEIELKFLIDAALARQIWQRARAAKLVDGKPTSRRLRSIYFDTDEHALRQAGIALRLRREGRRWVQTVKAGRKMHSGLSQADEAECPAPAGRLSLDAIPDEELREAVVDTLDGATLKPVCETAIRRTSCEIRLEDGTRAELAVDAGEIRAGGRKAELREAEIELIEGSPDRLFDIAGLLLPDCGLRFSRLPKSARGYLLAEQGYVEPPLAPRNALDVALDEAQTAEQAARDALRECVEQIAHNAGVVVMLDDPEGPHQLRIGLRRLRSVFAMFRDILDGPPMRRLNDEARWLGQEVGRLRDMDVLAGEIARREAAAHPEETTLAALADVLDGEATRLRGAVRGVLMEPRAQAFILDLARFTETRGWLVAGDCAQMERLAGPVGEIAGAALRKRWTKCRKLAQELGTLSPEARHELRKELKKLRYAVEFLCPLYPERRVRPFLKRLKSLQTVFGELNDAVLVKATFPADQPLKLSVPVSERAAGWLIGASQARAEHGWASAQALWSDLEGTRPFWK